MDRSHPKLSSWLDAAMRRAAPLIGLLAITAASVACDPGARTHVDVSEPPVHLKTDDAEEVHLGESMNEIGRRLAAVWFAGKAGNQGMLDYQLHEITEAIEELEHSRPIENGVDVHARLEADVASHFDALEEAVKGGDQAAFEEGYRAVMSRCSTCHAETGHPYIVVTLPEYNPYPALAF